MMSAAIGAELGKAFDGKRLLSEIDSRSDSPETGIDKMTVRLYLLADHRVDEIRLRAECLGNEYTG